MDIAHEALIRGWSRLREWIEQDRAALHTHQRFTEAASEWQNSGRDESFLYHGTRLAHAEEWASTYADDLNPMEQAFLDASLVLRKQAETEKEAQRQRELETARRLAEEAEARRQAEEQRAVALFHALEQQRELDRFKSEFIQNASHELRTPLALLRGYTELLDAGDLGELQPEQQHVVSIIANHAQTLLRLVEDLTTSLAIEMQQYKREPVDLAGLAHELLTSFQVVAEQNGLTLIYDIVPDLPLISGDLYLLRRMLDNLLDHTFKLTPAGGVVTMRLWWEKTSVVLEVTDTGTGIPADQLERVFERFYQVDGSNTRRYGGTGLGLALVKQVVDAHGGQITIQSSVGEGSTFQITLPLG